MQLWEQQVVLCLCCQIKDKSLEEINLMGRVFSGILLEGLGYLCCMPLSSEKGYTNKTAYHLKSHWMSLQLEMTQEPQSQPRSSVYAGGHALDTVSSLGFPNTALLLSTPLSPISWLLFLSPCSSVIIPNFVSLANFSIYTLIRSTHSRSLRAFLCSSEDLRIPCD